MAKKKDAEPVYSPLAELLKVLVFQFGGTRSEFIKSAEITQSQLSHWMNPLSKEKGPGVAACCRMARAGKCSLARMFAAAGHHLYAEIIEELYGHRDELHRAFRARSLSAHELAHLTDWRKLTAQEQRIHTTLIKHAHIARAAMTPASEDQPARKARA